ncbi:MAG: hypothetical protein QOE27_1472 [Solirubrobacteraceae bacterium]|nr:hypothetical protein [Solirubrobacteraceae bacterium]MEA2302012.1 hypothetical protein [Solirubrobacteraceae bacterium]MEA2356618.1 hypothetical protein [Solirubrobacteraceae bacterium]
MAVGVAAESEGLYMVVLRYLDVVLLVLGAPVAFALGAPVLGYAVGGAAWILQRVIAATDRSLIGKVTEPTRQLGYNLLEAFGRIWLLAGAIVIAGLVGRAHGLTAALVILGAYSVAFVIRLASGPPGGKATR